MSSEDKIVIKDACILFDLIDLCLIDDFFCLNLTVLTTSLVLAEVTDPTQLSIVQKHLSEGSLRIDQMGNDSVVYSIFNDNAGLSLTDSSVLELASRTGGILLSSDKSLRNKSRVLGITVCGILWIIEQLINAEIITKEEAILKLNDYPKINPRAPLEDIKKLVVRLRNS